MVRDTFEDMLYSKLEVKLNSEDPFNDPELNYGNEQPGAYVVLHPVTDHFYVGSTADLYKRRNEHRYYIQRGDHKNLKIRRHFSENPVHDFLFITWPTETREDAYVLEQKFLNESFILARSLNISPNARSNEGLRLSAATKNRISQIMADAWQDPEYRGKMMISRRDFFSDPEKVANLRRLANEAMRSPEHRVKMARIANEQWARPGTREAKAVQTKANWADPILREKLMLGRQKLRRKISADGIVFLGQQAVADHYGISIVTVARRIKSQHSPTWFYLTGEKENDEDGN